MSTYFGQIRHAVIRDDCDVVEVDGGRGGKLVLPWRNRSRVRRDAAQAQLNDLVTVLRRVAAQNELEWPGGTQ